ncbi:MAG: PGF-CTERM sorting domain-containing protein [Thermoplasmatota archaeon]
MTSPVATVPARSTSSRIALGALALVLVSTAFLTTPALAASHTWNVDANDAGGKYWFNINATDGSCTSGNNPTCTLAPGDTVTVNFNSKGGGGHDFEVKFSGQTTYTAVISCCVDAGKTATGTFTVPTGATAGDYHCLPHSTLGMKGTFTIQSTTTSTSPPTTTSTPASTSSTPGFELPLALVGLGVVAVALARRK